MTLVEDGWTVRNSVGVGEVEHHADQRQRPAGDQARGRLLPDPGAGGTSSTSTASGCRTAHRPERKEPGGGGGVGRPGLARLPATTTAWPRSRRPGAGRAPASVPTPVTCGPRPIRLPRRALRHLPGGARRAALAGPPVRSGSVPACGRTVAAESAPTETGTPVRGDLVPDCRCHAGLPAGRGSGPVHGCGNSGTGGRAARPDWLGIELNPDFAKLATERITTARENQQQGGCPCSLTPRRWTAAYRGDPNRGCRPHHTEEDLSSDRETPRRRSHEDLGDTSRRSTARPVGRHCPTGRPDGDRCHPAGHRTVDRGRRSSRPSSSVPRQCSTTSSRRLPPAAVHWLPSGRPAGGTPGRRRIWRPSGPDQPPATGKGERPASN